VDLRTRDPTVDEPGGVRDLELRVSSRRHPVKELPTAARAQNDVADVDVSVSIDRCDCAKLT
jgi:hypothetical protein